MNTTMRRRVAASAAALSLIAGGGVLAGCGSSYDAAAGGDASGEPNGVEKLPAKEILTKSAAAMATASSFSVSGSTKDDGTELSLDLTLGTGVGEGTTSLNGKPLMEFRETGGKIYWKITREGAEAILGPGDASKAIGGRWVVAPTSSDDNESLGPGEFGDKDALLASLVQEGATATTAGTGEVNGTPVVFVKTGSGADAATLAVQTLGEPYIVQVKGEGTGDIRFSDWNVPVSVTAPAGAVSPDDLIPQDGASG